MLIHLAARVGTFPAFEALGHGNTLISNQAFGMQEYVDENNSLVYGGQFSPVYGMNHADPLLYTGIENWFTPNILDMRMRMREAFQVHFGNEIKPKKQIEGMQLAGQKIVESYDYNIVGKKLSDLLEKAHESWKKNGRVILDELANKPENAGLSLVKGGAQ